QDGLGDVLGIGVLQAPPQAPRVDLPAVLVDEPSPGLLVVPPGTRQPPQERRVRPGVLGPSHGNTPSGARISGRSREKVRGPRAAGPAARVSVESPEPR